MANSELRKHKRNDTVKWIVVFVIIALLVCVVAGLAVSLSKLETTKSLNALNYEIGTLDENGEYIKDTSSIVTKDFVSVEGLSIKVDEDALVTYKVFFFDKDEAFISADAEENIADYAGSIPENAVYCKIVITPTNDSEVTFIEIAGYANQLTVSFAK